MRQALTRLLLTHPSAVGASPTALCVWRDWSADRRSCRVAWAAAAPGFLGRVGELGTAASAAAEADWASPSPLPADGIAMRPHATLLSCAPVGMSRATQRAAQQQPHLGPCPASASAALCTGC